VRVLVACSLGGAGHLNPLRPFLESLRAGGDEVLLVVPPALEARAIALGCPFRVGGEPPEVEVAPIREGIANAPARRAAVLSERDLFGRLCTTAMLPAMTTAFAEWKPQLVIRETCEYASAVLACRAGLAQVQVAISQAEVEASALETAAPALEAFGPGIVETIRSSPYLTRFPGSLDPAPYPDTRRYRLEPVAGRASLPRWWPDNTVPLAYLSFGSVTASLPIAPDIFSLGLEAVAELPLRVLFTVGNLGAVELGPLPANVHVEPWVPQEDVFGEASLVISHGGSGTVFGALAAGLPQVVLPLFADQFANGRRVEGAGAGLCVEGTVVNQDGRPRLSARDAPRVAAAVAAVLADPSYGAAAGRVAAEMAAQVPLADVLALLRAPSV
jgi:UDP:flavonoid glycosyltransferase YjiC (YdhE family)